MRKAVHILGTQEWDRVLREKTKSNTTDNYLGVRILAWSGIKRSYDSDQFGLVFQKYSTMFLYDL